MRFATVWCALCGSIRLYPRAVLPLQDRACEYYAAGEFALADRLPVVANLKNRRLRLLILNSLIAVEPNSNLRKGERFLAVPSLDNGGIAEFAEDEADVFPDVGLVVHNQDCAVKLHGWVRGRGS